ncbi:MAG: HNH endonuclease [Rhodobacteraceae bacterium]|nr:MAG: HNH endonuclease [Paracoccaceae bacterium]|tara:strand:+ start:77 stop:685 length:609 start_codon:yes stop_codon:yes gene_type:complete
MKHRKADLIGLNSNVYFQKQPNLLDKRAALVLNADYRPLSYLPLSVWPWQDAIKAKFLDRVSVIAEYDDTVHSPSISIKIPSVVVLRDYIRPSRSSAFTRFNLFLRDEFSCQYCGKKGEMTFDHVMPKCRGGKTTWENVVAACSSCNLRKGSRDLKSSGMKVLKKPTKPSVEVLMNKGRKFPPNYLHESWMDFLYWDAELES